MQATQGNLGGMRFRALSYPMGLSPLIISPMSYVLIFLCSFQCGTTDFMGNMARQY